MSLKKKIVLGIIAVIAIILIWLVYCLFRFGTYAYPWELVGLDNPEKYYEDNILPLYVKHGEELKLPDVDTSDWLTYRNEEWGFEFKYPKDYEVEFKNDARQEFWVKSIEKDEKGIYKHAVVIKGSLMDTYGQVDFNNDRLIGAKRSVKRDIDKKLLLYYAYTDNGKLFGIFGYNTNNKNFYRQEDKNAGAPFAGEAESGGTKYNGFWIRGVFGFNLKYDDYFEDSGIFKSFKLIK